MNIKTIALGSDHGGFKLKEVIKHHLEKKGYAIKDLGTHDKDSVDYPIYGKLVGEEVAKGACDKGIVCCGTGIGISIAANKVKGVRCAVVTESFSARMSVEHNNANVLALGQRVVGYDLALDIVDTWLKAEFEGGRHERRIDLIEAVESR